MTTRPEHLTHADATSPGDVDASSAAAEPGDSDAHLHLYDSQSFSPATGAPHEPVTPDFRKEMLQPHPTGAAAARRPPSIPLSPRLHSLKKVQFPHRVSLAMNMNYQYI